MSFIKSVFINSSQAINGVTRPISQKISSSVIRPIQRKITQYQSQQLIKQLVSLLRTIAQRHQFNKHTFFKTILKQQIHSKNTKFCEFIPQQLRLLEKSLKGYSIDSTIQEPLDLIHKQLSQTTGIFNHIVAIWVNFFISQASKLKHTLQINNSTETQGKSQIQQENFTIINTVIKRLLHRQLTIFLQFLKFVVMQQFQSHFQFFLKKNGKNIAKQQLLQTLKEGVTANSSFSKIKYFFLKNVKESLTIFNQLQVKQNLKDIQNVFPINKIANSFQDTFELLQKFQQQHSIRLKIRYLRQIDKKLFKDIMKYRQFYDLPPLKGLGAQQMSPIMVYLIGNSRKNYFGACQYLVTIICSGKQKIDQSLAQDFILQSNQKSYASFLRLNMHPVRFKSNIGLDGQINNQ